MEIYNQIVCCLDFSPSSDKAFDTAVKLARRDGAGLTLLHVASPNTPLLPGEPSRRKPQLSDAEKASRLRSYISEHYLDHAQGVDIRLELRQGHPGVEIVSFLESVIPDLVVVGSAKLKGINLVLLGSVAEYVSRKAPCSCLLVR